MKKLFLLLMLVLLTKTLFAYEHKLELETVIFNTLKSAHVNQCNPKCANEENGGYGFIFGYKALDKHLDVGIGRILLTNSFGDAAMVDFLQLDKGEFEYKFIRLSVAVWYMNIYGYKNDDGTEKVVNPGPWPKFQLGVNPIYFYTDNFFINYNIIYFPAVKINWWSFSVLCKF